MGGCLGGRVGGEVAGGAAGAHSVHSHACGGLGSLSGGELAPSLVYSAPFFLLIVPGCGVWACLI